MHSVTPMLPPTNGGQPERRLCHGRCGKQIEVPPDPEYRHKILLCEDCWTALESVLVHLVKIVKTVS